MVAPTVLRLSFSEPVVLVVTAFKFKGADDHEMPLAKDTFSGDQKEAVEVVVSAPLNKGTYTVSFMTASKDMHPITGDHAFVSR